MKDQGHSKVWSNAIRLPWAITVLGLCTGVVMLGIVFWTFSQVRSEHERMDVLQADMTHVVASIEPFLAMGSAEMTSLLDQKSMSAPDSDWLYELAILIGRYRKTSVTNREGYAREFDRLSKRLPALEDVRNRCVHWRKAFERAADRIPGARKRVETTLREMRAALFSLEGRLRLVHAKRVRSYRKALNQDASEMARKIIQETSQVSIIPELKTELADLSLLCERLVTEERIDNLVNLKDNTFKLSLNRLQRGMVFLEKKYPIFFKNSAIFSLLESLQIALFGQGFNDDSDHQTIVLGSGGLYSMCRDRLFLDLEHQKLQEEMTRIRAEFRSIRETMAARVEVLTHAAAVKAEGALKKAWETMVIVGVIAMAIFLVLSSKIAQVIKRQINAIKRTNEDLQSEINQRKNVESALRRSEEVLMTAKDELEIRVEERTADLTKTNRLLKNEITEKKQAENALLESEGRFRQLFDNLRNGVAVYEALDNGIDFILKDFNRAGERIEQVDRRNIIGRSVVEVFPGVKELGLFEVFQSVWRTGDSKHHPVSFYKDDRIVGWRDNYVFRLPSGEVVAVFSDETEHKQAEREKKNLQHQLQRSEKMKAVGTLAGGIAHDFNNILGSMMGYTELALEDVPEDSPAIESMKEVLEGGIRAKELVKCILTFSRQGEQASKPVRCRDMVKEALKLLKASLPSTVEIRTNVGSQSGMVLADDTQIHRVLLNLCTNASHAMPDGGVLEVNLEDVDFGHDDGTKPADLSPGPYVKLTVTDSGEGIKENVLGRIFEPFFTTKPPGKGTGMGLAMVHGIVTNHGGAITVDSKPHTGTTFAVWLPRIEKQDLPEDESPKSIPAGSGQVLLVDDEETIVKLGTQMLERLGYDVTAKSSSIEALETFRAHPEKFDLVITDMTMPNMTGEKLAEELMRIKPGLPVVMCTGYSELITEEKAKAMGIKELIMKPLLKRELAETLHRVLL